MECVMKMSEEEVEGAGHQKDVDDIVCLCHAYVFMQEQKLICIDD